MRSVLKTRIRWEYGNATLAKAFLKHPNKNFEEIIRAYSQYRTSEAYNKRRAESENKNRSASDADRLAADVALQARHLRAECIAKYYRGARNARKPDEVTWMKYMSGQLREEANAATRRAGYGAIRDEHGRIVETLTPTSFADYLSG